MQFKILAAVFAAMLGVAITSPVPAPAPAPAPTEVDCWPFAQNQCN
jgi:hypothetical protein